MRHDGCQSPGSSGASHFARAWPARYLLGEERIKEADVMDLGLKGKKAIVCAASKGLGKGCAQALAREGVDLTICARGAEALNATAKELSALGVKVTPVGCDVTTDAGRQALLAACPNPDILINNAGGPPPGDFKNFSLDGWRKAVEGNMISPIALIHATVYGMMERGFGRIVNITSASIKQPIASLELSNGARLGLTGAVATLARKAARSNVTINGILPGPFDTDRLRGTTEKLAQSRGVALSVVEAERKAAVPAGRFGTAEEFGATVAFLCSAHAGYITGQNLLIDGGGYPGAL
jgi:3-oxoacyl-[acyl-carrier protein] reductase